MEQGPGLGPQTATGAPVAGHLRRRHPDAIKASQDAATEATAAGKPAAEAAQHAKDAEARAGAANTEAGKAGSAGPCPR
ncbi:hypothetical protein AB0L59_28365 [Streptomyces sp. NPDC052109]|uniref:hypothetical protein n=1 Tax=Streptomyces sp. NPDC052109 TaxID=3155527 RepID=UPI003416B500